MTLNSEDSEALLLSGEHMSPPSLARSKSAASAVSLDMGSRDVDPRVKSYAAVGGGTYSPILKSSKSEPTSRVHCIPLLMVLVFFILWASSSEISPEKELNTAPKILATTMSNPTNLATSEDPRVFRNEISRPSTKTALHQDASSHSSHGTASLKTKSKDRRPRKAFMQGSARSESR